MVLYIIFNLKKTVVGLIFSQIIITLISNIFSTHTCTSVFQITETNKYRRSCLVVDLCDITIYYLLLSHKSTTRPDLRYISGKCHFGQRNRPLEIPLIFNFKNFGVFQKFRIRPEMNYLNAIFCLMQLTPVVAFWSIIANAL